MVGKAWWQAAPWGQEGRASFDLISRDSQTQTLAGNGPWQEADTGRKWAEAGTDTGRKQTLAGSRHWQEQTLAGTDTGKKQVLAESWARL